MSRKRKIADSKNTAQPTAKRTRGQKKHSEDTSEPDDNRNSPAIDPPVINNGCKPTARRAMQTKKRDENASTTDNDHDSQAINPPAAANDPKPKAKRGRPKKKQDENAGEADESHAHPAAAPTQARESQSKLTGTSEISNRCQLRSGKQLYVDVPDRKSKAKVHGILHTEDGVVESISTPRPRPLVRPRPCPSPDPWGGFNIAWNRARPARQEKRTTDFLQSLKESSTSVAASPRSSPAPVSPPSVSAPATLASALSVPSVPAQVALPSANGEGDKDEDEGDDEEEDTDQPFSHGSGRRRATITQSIHARFNPGSPSFVKNIRLAMDIGKKLDIDAPDGNKEPCTPRRDSPNHTATVDDTPEGLCWTPPSLHASSPTPPQICFKFHRWWSVYWGDALEEGRQTAVDRVTTWRRFDETEWKSVPSGYVVLRLGDKHERDGILAKYQNAAFAAAEQRRHELTRDFAKEEFTRSKEESRLAALAESAREKAEFAEAAKEEAVKKQLESAQTESDQPQSKDTAAQTKKAVPPKFLGPSSATAPAKSKALEDNHHKDYQTPSESDPSGSDFSTSHKALTRKRPLSSSDEDSSSEDSGESPSTLRCRPTKLPKLQLVPATPVPPSRSAVARSSQSTGARRSHSTPAQPGRPSAEQMKFVVDIRSTFYNSVKEGARLFNAKEETIIKQTGLGGMAKLQKKKLFNLYQAVIKNEPRENSSPGTWSQSARIDYENKTKDLSDEGREKFRLELMAQLGTIVKEEVKGVSPVMRMNRIEKVIKQMITGISQDHPDLQLFVIKVYTGDDPSAKALNGVLTGTQRGHETLQDLPLDLTKCISFLYDHFRGKLHADELKMLFDSKAPAVKPPVDAEMRDGPNAEARKSPPCTFIPLLEARKRRMNKKTEPGDLQGFVPPYTESIEDQWRGRRVVMSSVMRDLEARQGPNERGNHVPTTRKHVATCLKIALNSFRPASDPAKQFAYNHFVNQAVLYQLKLAGWPVAVGTAPGSGFNAQINQRAVWDSLAGAICNDVLVMEAWSEEEKKLTPGTVAYGEIPLVVSTQGLVMAKAKDCKAVAQMSQPKAKSHDQPQVEADVFDEHGKSDNDSCQSIRDIQRNSKTGGKPKQTYSTENLKVCEPPMRNPYRVVQTARTKDTLVMDTDLDGLTAFDESDLPEIALVDDATSYSTRKDVHHGQQYHPEDWHYRTHHEESAVQSATRVHWDQNMNIRQGSERRMETHEHYKVPHRGDLGGNQYRQLVVDIPKKANQVLLMPRTVPPQARPTGEYALPVSKARIVTPSSHTRTGQGPVQSSNSYAQLQLQPSTRTLPPTHPANRIPPPGQKFTKGKERARVHAAQSNFSSHVRQEQNELVHHQPYEHIQTHHFVGQRPSQEGQAGPSREVFLTREEELRCSHGFLEDAYMHAVYKNEEEEN